MSGSARQGYELKIRRIETLGPDTRSFLLERPAGFDFVPGQFLSLQLPLGESPLVRPYTIASDPEDRDWLEIVLNLVPGGRGSSFLFSQAAGATLSCTGPWGTFTLDQAPAAECVFVAAGTGIAAVRPMLRRALKANTGFPVCLHQAADSAAGLLFRGEWDAAARSHPQFRYDTRIGEPLEAPVVSAYIDADTDRSRHFFVCGVGDIVTRLRDRLRQAGYERRAVHYEKW